MAFYNWYDQDVSYNNMDYRPYYHERDAYRPAYFNAAPVVYRQDGRRRHQEPYLDDNYRRDYRHGSAYIDGRHGVVPLEQVFQRVDAPQWMDDGYRRHGGRQVGGYRIDHHDYRRDGGQVGRYRVDRRDFRHGGQDYGHENFLHGQDRHDHRHPNTHHASRTEVELYVPICCDKCERKLRKHLQYIEGVETITMDQTTKRVVVFGNVNPSHVLSRARQDKPGSKFWHSRYR